jgi:hypothetical protein
MASLYGVAIGGGLTGNIDANARKILGDGASGIGPYTRFGTPQLQAVKVVSSAYNFTTTPAEANSNISKAVRGLQQLGEIYYVGKPGADAANQFVALININNTYNGANQGSGTTEVSANSSYDAIEADILAELGGSGSITIDNVTLTELTFA